MLLLRGADIAAACAMGEAIDAVADGFRLLSSARAQVPQRTVISIPDSGHLLVMPAATAAAPHWVIKGVVVAPQNIRSGLPLVTASVLLGDARTGELLALLDGGALTALRTGAAGGVAARTLARPDASRVALFGAGEQAWAQLLAAAAVRALREVRIIARDAAHARAFLERAQAHPAFASVALSCPGPERAIDGADLVVTATSSHTPVFDGTRLPQGLHVTAVGSFRPDMRELDRATLRGALVAVDQRAGALHEAGELQGLGAGDVVELGEILAGTVPGRSSPDQRTVFKSVGNGIQDLVVASLAYTNALERGIGEDIQWP